MVLRDRQQLTNRLNTDGLKVGELERDALRMRQTGEMMIDTRLHGARFEQLIGAVIGPRRYRHLPMATAIEEVWIIARVIERNVLFMFAKLVVGTVHGNAHQPSFQTRSPLKSGNGAVD